MSDPRSYLAFQRSGISTPGYEGTSATNSGTTARAIPDPTCPQLMVSNVDTSIYQYLALGASSGPSAATTTQRHVLPPNSIQVFTLLPGDTHAYFISASGTPAYSMVSGRGY